MRACEPAKEYSCTAACITFPGETYWRGREAAHVIYSKLKTKLICVCVKYALNMGACPLWLQLYSLALIVWGKKINFSHLPDLANIIGWSKNCFFLWTTNSFVFFNWVRRNAGVNFVNAPETAGYSRHEIPYIFQQCILWPILKDR